MIIRRNASWKFESDAGGCVSDSRVAATLLQDIRDTLNELLAVFTCVNAQEIPSTLRKIERNTRKPRRAVRKR